MLSETLREGAMLARDLSQGDKTLRLYLDDQGVIIDGRKGVLGNRFIVSWEQLTASRVDVLKSAILVVDQNLSEEKVTC